MQAEDQTNGIRICTGGEKSQLGLECKDPAVSHEADSELLR
jgi:hypothetical protein